MQTIYCISGLGADEKVFQFLDLSFVRPVFIKWIPPGNGETLQSYAMRIKQEFIHEPEPFILGLSMGGMIAVEIAKTIPSARILIISSAKTNKEIPHYWKMFRYMPVYKILSPWIIKQSSVIQQYFLGVQSGSTKMYLNKKAITISDTSFYKWAVGAIITWQNKISPSNVIHIHGTGDRLLPYKFVKPDITIVDGGHLMIIENAEEISRLIKQVFHNRA